MGTVQIEQVSRGSKRSRIWCCIRKQRLSRNGEALDEQKCCAARSSIDLQRMQPTQQRFALATDAALTGRALAKGLSVIPEVSTLLLRVAVSDTTQ